MMLLPEEGDDNEVLASINTTPLVDVMLVLLIIFLITIPVAIHAVPVRLPQESSHPTQTSPLNVTITVDREGRGFWNETKLPDAAALKERLKKAAAETPQPEIHIRGDRDGRFGPIGKILSACREAGIEKVGFITEPAPGG